MVLHEMWRCCCRHCHTRKAWPLVSACTCCAGAATARSAVVWDRQCRDFCAMWHSRCQYHRTQNSDTTPATAPNHTRNGGSNRRAERLSWTCGGIALHLQRCRTIVATPHQPAPAKTAAAVDALDPAGRSHVCRPQHSQHSRCCCGYGCCCWSVVSSTCSCSCSWICATETTFAATYRPDDAKLNDASDEKQMEKRVRG